MGLWSEESAGTTFIIVALAGHGNLQFYHIEMLCCCSHLIPSTG